MKDSKHVWVVVGVVVVAIGVIMAFLWPSHKTNAPTKAAAPTPVYASHGDVVAPFPKQLILDPAAQVDSSYSIGYSSSTNQYTAQYNSSSSMATLYASYKSYLTANGWTITNDVSKYKDSRGLYSSNASSDVVVAIISKGTGSYVMISYVTK